MGSCYQIANKIKKQERQLKNRGKARSVPVIGKKKKKKKKDKEGKKKGNTRKKKEKNSPLDGLMGYSLRV